MVSNYFERDNGANALFLEEKGIELPRHMETSIGGKLLSDLELRGSALEGFMKEGDTYKQALKKSQGFGHKSREEKSRLW